MISLCGLFVFRSHGQSIDISCSLRSDNAGNIRIYYISNMFRQQLVQSLGFTV